MLYIKKGKEPSSLTSYKKGKFAYFDGCNKEDIRKHLLDEQGKLCAYCMRRIDENHMKIEHWYPEDRLTESQKLDYKNMFGVCGGHIDGQKGKWDTCDTHKGNQILTINPQNIQQIREIKYRTKSGEIYSDNPAINKDLNETLNLNSEGHLLKQNRKAVLDSVIVALGHEKQKGNWNYKMLQTMKQKYSRRDTEGKKREYAGIVLWYLDKKINSIEGKRK